MRASNKVFKALLLLVVCAGVAVANQVGAAAACVGTSATSAAPPRGPYTSSHIVLPADTIASGAHERGTLVISNQTGRPIVWKCAYLEVQLTNAQSPLATHPTPCGADRILRVGTTRLRFTLWASRSGGRTMKPLPPGKYHTQLLLAPPVAHPGPIAVRVVA